MSSSYTTTTTFTRTHARYLASKVAADLRQVQRFYGQPPDDKIDAYLEELTTLLAGRYVDSIEYGFRRQSMWVLALRYTARYDGSLDVDDRAGRIYVGADVSGASWYSYLVQNQNWSQLPDTERARITASLPIQRGSAPRPGLGDGVWVSDKTYSNGGVALPRQASWPQ